jgi:hypothetical protein
MEEHPFVKLSWHITHMGGWLHIVTAVLALANITGFLSLHWLLVFAPSLLYGAMMWLIFMAGHLLYALCRWLNSPDVPTNSYPPSVMLGLPRRKKAAA